MQSGPAFSGGEHCCCPDCKGRALGDAAGRPLAGNLGTQAGKPQLLPLLRRTQVSTKDIPIGSRPQDYMHTITAGQQHTDCPTLVAIPGYGAGSGFFFRVLDGLGSAFKLYCTDLLGTGLSGASVWSSLVYSLQQSFVLLVHATKWNCWLWLLHAQQCDSANLAPCQACPIDHSVHSCGERCLPAA